MNSKILEAIAKVIKQGERSMGYNGQITQCAYRGRKGLKCVVGHLIPDQLYTPGMEGLAVSDLQEPMVRHCMTVLGFTAAEISQLRSLQSWHDNLPDHCPDWQAEAINCLPDFIDKAQIKELL